MGLAGRLKRLKEHAEARGPVETASEEYRRLGIQREDEFEVVRVVVPALPAVDPEVLNAETPEELAQLSNGCAGLDCETFLIQPGRNTPRLVVTGYQSADGRRAIVTGDVRDPTVHARAFLAFTDAILEGKEAIGGILINQNIPFDFAVIANDAYETDQILGTSDEDGLFEQVMRRIFTLLDRHRVEDTMLRERLIDIAEGTLGKNFDSLTDQGNPRQKKYSLQALAQKYLGVELDKTTWRTGYWNKLNVPIEKYEYGARKYVTDDVSTALHVGSRQLMRAQLHGLPSGARIPNSAEQVKAAWSFQLMSSWGMRTNLSEVQKFETDLDHWSRRLLLTLKKHGLIRSEGRDAGTRDTKKTQALVKAAYKKARLEVPMTKSGENISLAGAVLEDIALIRLRAAAALTASGGADVAAAGTPAQGLEYDEKGRVIEDALMEEPLYAYSQYASMQKLTNTYLPVLYRGVHHPINARYETIVETGRASCYKPNLMNLPRGGSKTVLQRLQARVRQCFVPRPGFVFCSVDYAYQELVTLAQVCLWMMGRSKLAEAINAGIDPHLLMAAEQFLGITYEDALKRKKDKDVSEMRQLAKVANFALPGGVSPRTLVQYAKATYDVFITEDEARVLKEKWFMQWPEMREYFRRIGAMMKGYDDKGQQIGDIEQFVSGRIRGRTRYTAAANSFFQGLAADSSKTALYELQKACYLRDGVMYGARPIAFVHDEIITEVPEHLAHEYAWMQTKIMIDAMKSVCPDVKISAEPALMRSWLKNAEAVYDRGGRLIPWEPDVAYVKDPKLGLLVAA